MPGEASRQTTVLAALQPNECLNPSDLSSATGMSNRDVVKAVAGLIRRGYATRVEAGCYELTSAGQEARDSGAPLKSGPRKPLTQPCRRRKEATFRQKIWRALRMKQKATIGELVETAGDGTERAAESNAGRYLAALERAGYVRRLRRQAGTAPTSNGFLRYQIVRNTGPDAPVVQKGGAALFDPNENRVVWYEGGGQ